MPAVVDTGNKNHPQLIAFEYRLGPSRMTLNVDPVGEHMGWNIPADPFRFEAGDLLGDSDHPIHVPEEGAGQNPLNGDKQKSQRSKSLR